MGEDLNALIERARRHVMTPEERWEQRVSFVYAQQDHSSPHVRTKDQIREALLRIYGSPPPKPATR